jgi:hypothetical protein
MAALILEYVNVERFFTFIRKNTDLNSRLVCTIQSNNGVHSVSTTGVESIKSVASIFKTIDKEDLKQEATAFGFESISSEENFLPNGESLVTFEFSKKSLT